MSEGLANVGTLAGLATSLKNFSMDNLYSMTIPITPWVEDPNRSQLADGADAVWEKLRKGQPLVDKAETAAPLMALPLRTVRPLMAPLLTALPLTELSPTVPPTTKRSA